MSKLESLPGAAIVDIPLQPVSKNIFDVDSYP
ncbi:hypothetical protein, partial [Escherichia coli]